MLREFRDIVRFVRAASVLLAAGCLAAACSSGEPAADQQPDRQVTAFHGARIIVGDDRPVIEDGTFIVEQGRIVSVGVTDSMPIPEGAAQVDLNGKTVMPAIVDTHTHLSVTRDALVDDLRHKAYYGVGAVLSLGLDTGDDPFAVREEVIPGAARYRTAGRGITAPEPGRTEAPYWVTTDAEAQKAVEELAARKVDIVKIWVDDRNGQFTKLSAPLYRTVIDQAHARDLRVTAHIFALEDAKALLRAGIDAFAHSIRDTDVDAEALALFKEHPDVVLVPNLPNRGVASDLSWLRASVPAGEWQKLQEASVDNPRAQQSFAIQARNLKALDEAGVTIALGTDGNTPWAHHLEMEDMVAAGMAPADVIAAATSHAARFLRLDDMGTLEAGKSADFLVLDANPLDDITNTRRISSVYLRGEAVDRDGLREQLMTASPTQ